MFDNPSTHVLWFDECCSSRIAALGMTRGKKVQQRLWRLHGSFILALRVCKNRSTFCADMNWNDWFLLEIMATGVITDVWKAALLWRNVVLVLGWS